VAWCSGLEGQAKDWQTGVIIPLLKKGYRRECTNYCDISLFNLPGKVNAKCLAKRCRQVVGYK